MVSPIMTASRPSTVPEPRLLSLDVFRGGTMAAMILVNNAGSDAVFTPLEHAEWHGWTFTDTIFPFFLWMVGVSITFSFARRVTGGASRSTLFLHILRRSVLIYLVGFALVIIPRFDWAHVRLPGVLARIAVCYLIAGGIFLFTGVRGRIIAFIACLTSYWVLMMYVPVPGYGAGDLAVGHNFSNWIDRLALPGHLYARTKTWDPEGIVSTLPSIGTALLGIFAGMLLRSDRTREEKSVWLLLGGNVLMFAGMILATWMPINKKLWTDSFCLFMAGLACVVFAACYWLIDVQGYRRYTKPFQIFGMNALASYVLSGALAKTLSIVHVNANTSLQGWLFGNLYSWIQPPELGSAAFAASEVVLIFVCAWGLYRKGVFVRL